MATKLKTNYVLITLLAIALLILILMWSRKSRATDLRSIVVSAERIEKYRNFITKNSNANSGMGRPYEIRNLVKTKINVGKDFSISIVDAKTVPSAVDNTVCARLATADENLICIDKKDLFIGPSIEYYGEWEPHIWRKVKMFLEKEPNMGLIDVGANIGAFTVSAASMGRKVLAVEAFYENIQRLSESLRLNGQTERVTLVHNAVSDVYEEVFFWRPEDNPGGTHTLSKGVTLAPNKPIFKGDHATVGTIHLNDLAKVVKFKKAVMKVDIEGYENKAFRKIETLLDKVDIVALFMEWTVVKEVPAVVDLVKTMQGRNYQAKDLYLNFLPGSSYEAVRLWPRDIVWVKK